MLGHRRADVFCACVLFFFFYLEDNARKSKFYFTEKHWSPQKNTGLQSEGKLYSLCALKNHTKPLNALLVEFRAFGCYKYGLQCVSFDVSLSAAADTVCAGGGRLLR